MKLWFAPLFSLFIGSSLRADEPAVFIELPWRYVLGAHQGGTWFTSEQAGKNLGQPRSYQLYTLKGQAGSVKAGKALADVDVCPDVWVVPITPEPELDNTAIGISATWNPQPRLARLGPLTAEAYIKSTQELLASKGMKKPLIKLREHLRIDLDNDGEEEVLIAAEHYADQIDGSVPASVKSGDYSVVYLRRLVNGKVKTQILGGDFHAKASEFSAPNTYKVSGLLDLDGDGTLEILIHSAYYEGGGTTVWKLKGDTFVKVLDLACGV